MGKADSIWSRARADLVFTTEAGEPDIFLWDHTQRVTRTAQHICQLPSMRAAAINDDILQAGGLYHDAGWAVLLKEGQVTRLEVGSRPRFENHRELGAMMMEERLADLLPPDVIRRTTDVIQSLHDREIEVIEAQILTEAENLCEIGLLSLWPTIRRATFEGKGVQSAIDTWRRQKEYRFWVARINDSFRFEAVRELARARLAQMDALMTELEKQYECSDLLI